MFVSSCNSVICITTCANTAEVYLSLMITKINEVAHAAYIILSMSLS